VYRRFDILVVPSRAPLEQFGRVVIEALAAEVPVIASDAGELPRLIAQTGGGWLFPSGDAGALQRVIEEVRQHPEEARRRAEHGRRVVVEELSVGAVARRFTEVVERTLAESDR
jgi:glycosyltransferase involved in cell wall biosynthesis